MDRDDWILVLSVATWLLLRVERHREARRLTEPAPGECIVCGARAEAGT